MFLGNYFKNISDVNKKFFFSGISFDSKKVKKNHIFFAIKGNTLDGNKFIPIAIKKGSRIIVSEKRFKESKDGVIYIHSKEWKSNQFYDGFKIYNYR